MLRAMLLKLKGEIASIASEYYPAMEDYDYEELVYTIKLIDMIIMSNDFLYVPVVRQQMLSMSDYFQAYFESNLNRRINELANNFNICYNNYIIETCDESKWFK